jgi:hypothetical protein
MKLLETSISWAINHLYKESDNDLFPRQYELDIIKNTKRHVIDVCKNIDIGNYKWNAARRFLIPKDDLSFRNATQLDIIDSIMLGAIIYQFGANIESKRLPTSKNTIFSYRFAPEQDGTLYGNKKAWENFWISCKISAAQSSHIVVCDISDFYNQIYLHTVENQLAECGLPNPIIRSIKELLVSITQRSSKGIPIGPHSFHLIAEMSLIPFDDNLTLRGLKFKRYVDDIVVFCDSYKEAKIALNTVALILDKEQRLTLQRQKTKILSQEDFIKICKANLYEEVGNDSEQAILDIINEYSDGNAYAKVKLTELSDEDLKKLAEIDIVELLRSYLDHDNPNFEKIRWIYRRLSQIGLSHAIDFSLDNFDRLIPALNDVCLYVNACAENYESDWQHIGAVILQILEDDIIESNEFYQISLYNLFVHNANLNHISTLISSFGNSSNSIKRKILLASMHHKSASWLRELKEQFYTFDVWTKRAYLIAASKLPREERDYFFKGIKQKLGTDAILEDIIIKWAKNQ